MLEVICTEISLHISLATFIIVVLAKYRDKPFVANAKTIAKGINIGKSLFEKKLIRDANSIIEKSVKDLRSGPIRRFAYYLIDRTISSIKTHTN